MQPGPRGWREPEALGIFGFSFLDQNRDTIQGMQVGGAEPTFETIAAEEYPLSRPLFFYVKNAHVGTVPGIEDYVTGFTSEEAWGPTGYLAEKGLIPLEEQKRESMQQQARNFEPMTEEMAAAEAAEVTMGDVGIQLYTLRNVDQPFTDVLERVAAVGFDGVEFAGFGDATVGTVADTLADLGLPAIKLGSGELADSLEVVRAQAQPLDAILRLAARGEQQDRRVGAFAHPFGDVEPVHAGHHHVQDHQIEAHLSEQGQRLLPVRGGGDAQTPPAQKLREKLADAVVVVDDEDMSGAPGHGGNIGGFGRDANL